MDCLEGLLSGLLYADLMSLEERQDTHVIDRQHKYVWMGLQSKSIPLESQARSFLFRVGHIYSNGDIQTLNKKKMVVRYGLRKSSVCVCVACAHRLY